MVIRWLVLLLFTFTSGCATRYKGPLPDFTKSGAEAQAEIDRFTLKADPWGGRAAFRMGNSESSYWLTSLRPVIDSVSPEATKRISHVRRVDNVFNIALMGYLAYFLFAAQYQKDSGNQIVSYTFLASALGIGIYNTDQIDKAGQAYNRDLKNKFSPTLSYRWNY